LESSLGLPFNSGSFWHLFYWWTFISSRPLA